MLKLSKKLLPNYLTILRFICVPIIFSLILVDCYIGAIVVFIISGITDVLDGRIARKYNLITEWGCLADPLADKLTQISTITALIMKKVIPFWILVIITVKELIMIIGGFTIYRKKIIAVKSKWYGKVATIMFFIAIVLSLLSKTFAQLNNVTIYVFYIAIAITIFAGMMYGKDIVVSEIKRIDSYAVKK